MERLTEMQSSGYDLKEMNGEWCDKYCKKQRVETCNECVIYQAIQKLAEYENLEEQGLLLRLPCKVRDIIYFKSYREAIVSTMVTDILIDSENIIICDEAANQFYINDFEKTVFLTREEAEQKLKEVESD